MPLISIIIPIYNASTYLYNCLESIRKQIFQDFECILVNDGSTDDSLQICYEFAHQDKRFKIISVPNGGPSKARNIGLNNSISKWVTFVDADDFIYPSYLENFVKYNKEDIYIQVIQSYECKGFNGIDEDTLYPSTFYKYTEFDNSQGAEYIEKYNLLYNWGVWCKIFSLEIINKFNIRFDENLKIGEDGLFWHTYLQYIEKIIYVPEIGYSYFCPKNHVSLSRPINRKINKNELFPLVSNYKVISSSLHNKFNLLAKSSLLLQNLYVNNYFKLLLQYDLNNQDILELKKHRPSVHDLPKTTKGFMFFIINFFPIFLINKLSPLKK